MKIITFQLFPFELNRDAPYGKVIKIDDDQIPIHANKPVAFLIHGFMSEANNSNHFELITAWLQKDDINIFSLDWSDAACDGEFSVTDLLSYNSAVKNVPIVSEYLTNFTIKLVEEYDVRVDEILVIGHSLGAHVAGLSGKSVQGILKQKYKQIIGLDPAGPEFNDRDCTEKLCNSDAAFVQVFHTSHFAGINYAIGDADFYFNGGNTQPGCILTVCSHSRAVIYLTMILLHPPCFIGTAWTVGSE
ncbi:phospholipase A1-like [Ceratina calcarata]|uniref:phospholipase A1 n=1 Tax=Ceratina calcarata TaxID=156304 RepID=A0AAJ7JB87_9HYME|nr:phospholipase A1-like [Ceratina calcarata]